MLRVPQQPGLPAGGVARELQPVPAVFVVVRSLSPKANTRATSTSGLIADSRRSAAPCFSPSSSTTVSLYKVSGGRLLNVSFDSTARKAGSASISSRICPFTCETSRSAPYTGVRIEESTAEEGALQDGIVNQARIESLPTRKGSDGDSPAAVAFAKAARLQPGIEAGGERVKARVHSAIDEVVTNEHELGKCQRRISTARRTTGRREAVRDPALPDLRLDKNRDRRMHANRNSVENAEHHGTSQGFVKLDESSDCPRAQR